MTPLARRPARIVIAALLSGAALLAYSAVDGRHSTATHRAISVSLGNLDIRVVRAGSGTPVLLLHGYGESLLSWRAVFDELALHADVIAFDLPGFGLSSKPDHGYSADSLAQVALRLMDTLGVRRAVFVGHSLGGAVSAAAAARAPDRLLGLVLIDPALITPPALSSFGNSTDQTERMRSIVAAYYEDLRSRFAGAHDPEWLSESDAAMAYEPAQDPAYRQALVAVLRQFDFQHLTAKRAARLTMPALLIWGAQDPVVPSTSAQGLLAALPRARLAIVPRSWHRPHVERPGVVAGLIEGFLGEIARAASE